MTVNLEPPLIMTWDEAHLAWAFKWSGRLTYEQIISLLYLRRYFLGKKGIRKAPFQYDMDKNHLTWHIYLDATQIENHTEHQCLKELITSKIKKILFGDASDTRPARTHVV